MRIACVVSSFPVLSETFILNQITGLLDLGHDVEIFALLNSRSKKVHPDIKRYGLEHRVQFFNIPNYKVLMALKAPYLILTNFYKNPNLMLRVLNIFKYKKSSLLLLYAVIPFLNNKFDIIHCHFGPNGLIGALLKKVGVPGRYVTSFHGYDVNSYPQVAGRDIYKDLFETGDLFTCNTRFTKQQAIRLGCDDRKVIILPLGFDIKKYRFSERLLKESEPVKILTVGRLVEKKGYEYTIRAIAKLVDKHIDIRYIIAGNGPLRGELESVVSELGIQNCVTFLGAVDENEVLSLYQQAHIFVLSSITAKNGDQEGQALVLQEAQASGLPVVSTLHNGIPDGVLDNRSGFLVPERDVNMLAEKIEYLIEHPGVWAIMGKTGREFVEKNYDIKVLSQKLVEIYKNLLEE